MKTQIIFISQSDVTFYTKCIFVKQGGFIYWSHMKPTFDSWILLKDGPGD